jgi:Zn finger protein HypA/HybF involved in hydrogenase expression
MKHYIVFNPDQGLPFRSNLYYECTNCQGVVPSKTLEYLECPCGNIQIDGGASRLNIKNYALVRLFEEMSP